jgi:diaminopimelate epimerase
MTLSDWLSPHFFLGHGLGNDYLVFEAVQGTDGVPGAWPRLDETVRAVCARGSGLGSDGIVVLLDRHPTDGIFPLAMFNPDGSAFERSGNGLRVLGAYLLEEGLIPILPNGSSAPFRVQTGGDVVEMVRHGPAARGCHDIEVEMGQAQVAAAEGRTLEHPTLGPITYIPVRTGNPHAVMFDDAPRPEKGATPAAVMHALARLDGPELAVRGGFVAVHPSIPGGTNVQWAQVLGPDRVVAGIWERGVGRTPASGTSACAIAVAGVASGRLSPGTIEVRTAGGTLWATVTPRLEVTLRGPVQSVARGTLTEGFPALPT